jgi:hypothetical protein
MDPRTTLSNDLASEGGVVCMQHARGARAHEPLHPVLNKARYTITIDTMDDELGGM